MCFLFHMIVYGVLYSYIHLKFALIATKREHFFTLRVREYPRVLRENPRKLASTARAPGSENSSRVQVIYTRGMVVDYTFVSFKPPLRKGIILHS